MSESDFGLSTLTLSERYSMDDMMKLLKKAETYCSDKMVRCKYLYRNKEKGHFENILKGDGIMKLNLKDYAGDPRTPINGNIEAIFFTATVDWRSRDGEPIPVSPYGPDRLLVDIDYLIQPSKHNLYFADFYCVKQVYHYVVLVVAEPKSAGDKFCFENLPKLDWDDNKFLISRGETMFQVSSTQYLIVEVLYASEINIKNALAAKKAFTDITDVTLFNYGVPKNKECTICNI